MIVELIVTITGEWSEKRSAEELIWTCLDEIYLVMRKSRRSGILFVVCRWAKVWVRMW